MSRCWSCVLGLWFLILAGCAPKPLRLPTDPGTPLSDAVQIHRQLSSACAAVKTLSAELGLSGRAGASKLRGRVLAGFARPAAMRLEGLAPFGAPAFILAAREGQATLLLPRDDRVLRNAGAEEILGALTGLTLAPADLQAILTGCVVPSARATGGALHGGDWASIALDAGATLYLKRSASGWQLRAARRAGWQIEYDAWEGSFPHSVRLRSEPSAVPVDLLARVSQLETNVALGPEVFQVDVPAGTTPITLEELRDSGPLRDRGSPGPQTTQ